MKSHIRVEKMIVSQPRKLVTQSFTFFENKNYTIQISFTMEIAEFFTLHLMVYAVFFNKTYLEIKL
jgi:hypothetical protein